MHFGLRGRKEHHDMMVEDFSIEKDDDGVKFITFFRIAYKDKTRWSPSETSASYFQDVRYRIEEVPRRFVQAIPRKTPRRDEENRAILPGRYGQA